MSREQLVDVRTEGGIAQRILAASQENRTFSPSQIITETMASSQESSQLTELAERIAALEDQDQALLELLESL